MDADRIHDAEEAEGGESEGQEAQQVSREELLARLDAFGESLAKTRAEAINARVTSGIEKDWQEDEEFYEGIDDANRGEVKSNWASKPPGQAVQTAGQTRSTVFPNITGPYCDAASARIADMLLPTDDRTFAILPTPIPQLDDMRDGKPTPEMQQMVQQAGPPEAQQSILAQAMNEAMQVIDEAKRRAEKAQARIDDWMVESQWHAEVREVIEFSARIGAGILKGPVPIYKRQIRHQNGGVAQTSRLQPGSKSIDPWNFYPDPACGEDIHNGSYTWERDYLTVKQLRDLKAQDGYLAEQIDACIEEGPRKAGQTYVPSMEMAAAENGRYEVWYYHGTAEKDDIGAAGCDCEEGEDHIPVMVMMVNNRVIKVSLNPLDTGEFPYDVMVWRKRRHHWAGIGVARQIRTAQRIVTAASRALMDNAGIAAGPMLVFRQGVVTPADGIASIGPRKIWYIAEDASEIADATKAIGVIKVDMLVAELMQVIQYGLKLAEDTTGLPMLLQGQQGSAPDTVGGMTMLNNNGTAVLRRLARTFDDRVTEPHVRRYYAWLLQYGEDDEKGDFSIDARGSSALVERDLQNQQILQMAAVAANPVFGLDPKKWAVEMLKAQKFDPKKFEFDDEQWQQIVANMGQGPQDPRMQIAQLKAEADGQAMQFKERLRAMELQFEAAENARDRELDVLLKEMERDGQQTISMNEIRARLADTAMRTRAQKELSLVGASRQALTPPTEPAGRAPAGQAFQR